MQSSFHPIMQNIFENQLNKRKKEFNEIEKFFEQEDFRNVYNFLKTKFQVTFKLMGESNSEYLTYFYMKQNPALLMGKKSYGENFPEFLVSIPELENFQYLFFIARLDWYWFAFDGARPNITLPLGTLKSWGSLARGEDQIEIEIDLALRETLEVVKINNSFEIRVKK